MIVTASRQRPPERDGHSQSCCNDHPTLPVAVEAYARLGGVKVEVALCWKARQATPRHLTTAGGTLMVWGQCIRCLTSSAGTLHA